MWKITRTRVKIVVLIIDKNNSKMCSNKIKLLIKLILLVTHTAIIWRNRRGKQLFAPKKRRDLKVITMSEFGINDIKEPPLLQYM